MYQCKKARNSAAPEMTDPAEITSSQTRRRSFAVTFSTLASTTGCRLASAGTVIQAMRNRLPLSITSLTPSGAVLPLSRRDSGNRPPEVTRSVPPASASAISRPAAAASSRMIGCGSIHTASAPAKPARE